MDPWQESQVVREGNRRGRAGGAHHAEHAAKRQRGGNPADSPRLLRVARAGRPAGPVRVPPGREPDLVRLVRRAPSLGKAVPRRDLRRCAGHRVPVRRPRRAGGGRSAASGGAGRRRRTGALQVFQRADQVRQRQPGGAGGGNHQRGGRHPDLAEAKAFPRVHALPARALRAQAVL